MAAQARLARKDRAPTGAASPPDVRRGSAPP